MVHDAPAEPDADSVLERLAVAVLSGGMSGRLFTEVREKRGLCYAVYATYAARPEAGAVYAYAGTTDQRADEIELRQLDPFIDGVGLLDMARTEHQRVQPGGIGAGERTQPLQRDQRRVDERPRPGASQRYHVAAAAERLIGCVRHTGTAETETSQPSVSKA